MEKNKKKKVNKKDSQGCSGSGLAGLLVSSAAIAAMVGVSTKMIGGLFGGNTEVGKKELLKGMVNLVCENYEKKNEDLSTANSNLVNKGWKSEAKIKELEERNRVLEFKVEKYKLAAIEATKFCKKKKKKKKTTKNKTTKNK